MEDTYKGDCADSSALEEDIGWYALHHGELSRTDSGLSHTIQWQFSQVN